MKSTCTLKAGDRIRLISMDDLDPIPAGTIGTVVGVYPQSDWTQVDVDWDIGRSLMLSIPPDRVVRLAAGDSKTDSSTKGN